MGLVKMKEIKLVSLQSQQEALFSRLVELGLLHIRKLEQNSLRRELLKDKDAETDNSFLEKMPYWQQQTEQISLLEQEYNKYRSTLKQVINESRKVLAVRTGLFTKQRSIDFAELTEYGSWDKFLPIIKDAEKMVATDNQINQKKVEIAKKEHELAYIEEWLNEDFVAADQLEEVANTDNSYRVKANSKGFIKKSIYRLNDGLLQERLKELLAAYNEDKEYQIYLYSKGAFQYFLYLNKEESILNFQRFFGQLKQTISLQSLIIPAHFSSAEAYKSSLQAEIVELQKKVNELERVYKSLALNLNEYENCSEYLKLNLAKLSLQKEAIETRNFAYLEAYIPAHVQSDLVFSLTKEFYVAISISDVTEFKEYPIGFANTSLVRPYESITEMFSLPNAGEIDPTPTFAPFYFLFYGIMFSDIGYGLLLSLITGFLLWGVKVQGSSQKLVKVLFQCGLSATFWGYLFGSFFGNLIDTIYGIGTFRPLWFNPMEEPLQMIGFAVFLGYLHLMMALGVKMYISMALKKWQEAWFDVFPWMAILTGLHLLALEKLFLFKLPYLAEGLIVTGIGLLLIFAGRPSYNPLLRLVKGLGALYGSTAYLSDLMSYTRILALNLATAVIAMVVNRLGSIAGFSFFGILLFVVVGILGHTLNFVLSALGAYVHTTRLQFVEFFSKFYEGGGVMYNPTTLAGDYLEIKPRKLYTTKKVIKENLAKRVKNLRVDE